MKSRATRKFWEKYNALPGDVQQLAIKQYGLWLRDRSHPSVQFKRVGKYWSARVTDSYRTLGILDGDTIVWFWIGVHDEYAKLVGRK